jgi:4-aminobutyrate aminotransferase / (S)-3-amino-2-methylpropionate transaminase
VDETRTGVGSTGKMWAHEYWYLKQTPDIVTFGGKYGLGGFFTNLSFRPVESENFAFNN